MTLSPLDQNLLRTVPDYLADIVRDCAAREKVTVADVFLPGRCPAVVSARHSAIVLTKALKPYLSHRKVAQWFRRDESVVRYALAKHGAAA